jgi:ubiquinone biosynthesis monooxygenase Coq7
MWDQEKDHLRRFEYLALKHRASRSLLTPFWSVAGFAMGAGSALLGARAAMACTVAVERVITEHYDEQIRELMADDPNTHRDLLQVMSRIRDDEQHHHDTGLEHEAELAPAYKLLTAVIDKTCRVAISVAQKL